MRSYGANFIGQLPTPNSGASTNSFCPLSLEQRQSRVDHPLCFFCLPVIFYLSLHRVRASFQSCRLSPPITISEPLPAAALWRICAARIFAVKAAAVSHRQGATVIAGIAELAVPALFHLILGDSPVPQQFFANILPAVCPDISAGQVTRKNAGNHISRSCNR